MPATKAVPTATPLPPVRFPQDEAPHTDLTEWWYYTGHFHSASGHEYGFELTFFQTLRGSLPPYYAAHYAISDISRGQFHYDQQVGFGSPSSIPPAGSTQGFHLALNGWTATGLNGHDQLHAEMADYTIDLKLTDALPHPILHNGNGLITYGEAGYSYYYSRPLLMVSGTVNDHGTPVAVTGQAWMDHQWGNFLTAGRLRVGLVQHPACQPHRIHALHHPRQPEAALLARSAPMSRRTARRMRFRSRICASRYSATGPAM